MSKNWILIFIILIVIGVIIYIYFPRKLQTIKININAHQYQLEIAKTIPQHTAGLMNRKKICPNCGMLFVFNIEMPLSFWMKNTYIPLDIIFLDKSGTVLNIAQGKPESLELINSVSPAKYVIEINANECQRIGLKPGDKIEFTW